MLPANLHLLGGQAAVPILPFHVVLRLQLAEDRFGVELVDVGVADEADGIHDRRALLLGKKRRMLGPHVAVGCDVAQQGNVELFGGRTEVLDVAAVQRIERAIDHRHFLAVVLQLIEGDNHDLTRSPLSCSSCSALSKKSTATSGVVRAHSINSEKPCSNDTFGANPSVWRAREISAVLWRMSNFRPVWVICGSIELPSSRARSLAMSRIVTVSPEPTLTGR